MDFYKIIILVSQFILIGIFIIEVIEEAPTIDKCYTVLLIIWLKLNINNRY